MPDVRRHNGPEGDEGFRAERGNRSQVVGRGRRGSVCEDLDNLAQRQDELFHDHPKQPEQESGQAENESREDSFPEGCESRAPPQQGEGKWTDR
jgi:hypothetical protein